MNNFQYKILNSFYKTYRSKEYLKKKFKKLHPSRIDDILDFLEDNMLIEEATAAELDALRSNSPFPDSDSSDFTGTYFITETGRQLIEKRREENKRFYLPFFVTTLLSIISLIISIVSITISTIN